MAEQAVLTQPAIQVRRVWTCSMEKSKPCTVFPHGCAGKYIVALIGPSGCGKSTFLRSFNRMNELIDGVADRRHCRARRCGHLRPTWM